MNHEKFVTKEESLGSYRKVMRLLASQQRQIDLIKSHTFKVANILAEVDGDLAELQEDFTWWKRLSKVRVQIHQNPPSSILGADEEEWDFFDWHQTYS